MLYDTFQNDSCMSCEYERCKVSKRLRKVVSSHNSAYLFVRHKSDNFGRRLPFVVGGTFESVALGLRRRHLWRRLCRRRRRGRRRRLLFSSRRCGGGRRRLLRRRRRGCRRRRRRCRRCGRFSVTVVAHRRHSILLLILSIYLLII